MQALARGTIVGDAHGKLFVVWGCRGDCVSLMPTVKVGRIRRTYHIVRVRAQVSGDPNRIVAVNAAERRHVPCAELLAMGTVYPPGLAMLDLDMTAQAREIVLADAREQKAACERAAANRMHQARHRAVMAMARQIADAYWPAEVAA